MPIYEYTCGSCAKPFEILIRNSSDKPACPHCGATKAEKRFSTFGVSMGGGSAANVCGMPEASAPRFAGDCGASWCKPGGGCQ